MLCLCHLPVMPVLNDSELAALADKGCSFLSISASSYTQCNLLLCLQFCDLLQALLVRETRWVDIADSLLEFWNSEHILRHSLFFFEWFSHTAGLFMTNLVAPKIPLERAACSACCPRPAGLKAAYDLIRCKTSFSRFLEGLLQTPPARSLWFLPVSD